MEARKDGMEGQGRGREERRVRGDETAIKLLSTPPVPTLSLHQIYSTAQQNLAYNCYYY